MNRTAAAIVLDIAYGHIVADEGDSYVTLADTAMQSSAQASFFGTYLVDYIPILKYVPSWMPGASFKRNARKWRRLSREMLESQFEIVKQKMVRPMMVAILRCLMVSKASGTALPCIATRELEDFIHSDGNGEELIKNITAITYAGKSRFMTYAGILLTSKCDSWGWHRKCHLSVVDQHTHSYTSSRPCRQ